MTRVRSFLLLLLLAGLSGAAAASETAYAGIWRGGNDGHYLWAGVSWADFEKKWDELSKKGLRLVDVEISEGTPRKFTGVWRAGSDAHYLWSGADWKAFEGKWNELSKKNLRLTVIRSWTEAGQRKYLGVWRAGSDAHYLWSGVDWKGFESKWNELAKQNLRLVDVETWVDGGTRKYAGAWRAGSDAHYLWAGVEWGSFDAKFNELGKQNLRLTVLRTYVDGGQRKYLGVWRAGSDGHYLWAGVDFENFRSKWHALGDQHLRLVKACSYPSACKSGCANQVISPGGYDYQITGHDKVYYRPVDTAGGEQYVRLSALNHPGAPFSLPFSDASVKRWNGWRYGDGTYHHATDYAIDLARTFQVKTAAPGKVVFIGWDNWSGNTVVVSHDAGGVKDAYRTVYMHLRNGPANDCEKAWTKTVPSLNATDAANYKGHLTATGCAQTASARKPTGSAWGTDAQKIKVSVNQQLAAGAVIGYAGDTGRGGNGFGDGRPNMHLHIFWTARDATNGKFYFIDPYGLYAMPSCYPAGNTDAIGASCGLYPKAFKGGKPAYP